MSSYLVAYLIIFIPLIFAILSFLINFPKSNFIIFTTSAVSVLLLSIKILFDVLIHEEVVNDLGIKPISIATEYRIDLLSILFLLIVVSIKTITAFFYKNDIDKTFDKESKRLFYTVNSLNLFGLIGIFTTNNILNLYVFIEIYSFTFYALSGMSKELSITKLAFKYFCQGVAGSTLILISLFSLYIITDSLNIDHMINYIDYLIESNQIIAILLFLFIFVGILLKFFPIWFHFRKVGSNDYIANYLSISVLFIKINVGLYLLMRLIFLLFGIDFAFEKLELDIVLILAGVSLVFYSNIEILRHNNLKVITSYLCFINLGLIFIAMSLSTKEALAAGFFYIVNLSFVNLLVFLFASYLLRNFSNCEIRYLHIIRKNNVLVGVPLKVIIFFIAGFPLTTIFMANWNLAYSVMNFGMDIFILVPITTTFFALIKLAIKMINYFYFYCEGEDIILEKSHSLRSNNFLYLISFWFILTIAIFFVINASILTNIGNNLAVYLLY